MIQFLASPPRRPCVPTFSTHPPVRSHPLPRPAVCVPVRSASPPVRSLPGPCPAVCVPHRPTVSESRIKRITQITRITPHIPTAALSFPSAMSFACPVAIDLSPRPRY